VKDSAELVSQLARIHAVGVGVEFLETLTLEQLTKAKYNYNSRRYPLVFGDDNNNERITEKGKKRDRAADNDDHDHGGEIIVQIPTSSMQKYRRVYDATQGCLCPLLDILNHAQIQGNQGQEQLSFDYTSDPQQLKVKTRVPVIKGDEIYSNYGSSSGISNDQLLLQFGFCDMSLPSVFTVVLGGERFDLSANAEAGLPARLVSDGGQGLHGHLTRKLTALLAADESSNAQVVWYMTQQRKLLEELLAQCEALEYYSSSEDE
jgi:hypothetical protein